MKENILQQEKIDKTLVTLPCKETVLLYLLAERQKNREQNMRYANADFLDSLSTAAENMRINKVELDRLERLFSSENKKSICEQL